MDFDVPVSVRYCYLYYVSTGEAVFRLRLIYEKKSLTIMTSQIKQWKAIYGDIAL